MQLKLDTAALDEQKLAPEAAARSEAGTDRDDGLLRTAIPIMIAAYGTALAIVAYTFWRSGYTLLSIAVCIVYVVMFFGVPIVMARIRNRHDDRWAPGGREAMLDHVDVFGGSIGRKEALLQMSIVPLAVLFSFAAFAVIWLSVAP